MAVLTDTTGQYRWQDITTDDWVSCSQAWWIWEHGDAVNWDGFAVQCGAKYRHEGACEVDGWRWDRRTGIPLN